MFDRLAQAIAGYTWQQKQSFDVAESAVNNSFPMGILSVAMMTGVMSGGGMDSAAACRTAANTWLKKIVHAEEDLEEKI